MKEPQAKPTIDLEIQKIDGNIWKGKAFSVSAKNIHGEFDILPYHANFISILLEGPVVIREESGQTKKISLPRSVMHLKDNYIKIYSAI